MMNDPGRAFETAPAAVNDAFWSENHPKPVGIAFMLNGRLLMQCWGDMNIFDVTLQHLTNQTPGC